jgi:hypothetical protein
VVLWLARGVRGCCPGFVNRPVHAASPSDGPMSCMVPHTTLNFTQQLVVHVHYKYKTRARGTSAPFEVCQRSVGAAAPTVLGAALQKHPTMGGRR